MVIKECGFFWVINIYLHGGMTTVMIVDLFITEHSNEYNLVLDFIVLSSPSFYIMYCSLR